MDFVYHVPISLDPSIIEWMTWNSGEITEDQRTFLCHLSAIRQAMVDDVDGAIIVENNVDFVSDFDEKMDILLEETPGETDVLLLSHYVTDWSGIEFEGDLLCTVTPNVHGSFAYWISRPWIERCLLLYDRPLYTIGQCSLHPTRISRAPHWNSILSFPRTYMAYRPLAFKKGGCYDDYFRHYR